MYRVSQKFMPLIPATITFDLSDVYYTKSLKDYYYYVIPVNSEMQ